MENLIIYLIRSILISALLMGYYVLVLRGKRMHTFNRFYLLSCVVVALVLPLVHIPWAPWEENPRAVEKIVIAPAAAGNSGGVFWWKLVSGAGVLVSVVLVLLSIRKIRALYLLKHVSRCTPMDGYELVETEAPGTPFSFFHNLFWRRGLSRDEGLNQKMLAHELAHIRGRHSLDIVGIQAVLCVFWMNPFFWYIRQELSMVLEFVADAASGAEGDPEILARMLLQAYAGGSSYAGPSPALVNSFFHSPIKRRLVMITNNNGSRRAWLRKALVIPVALGAVLFFACSKDQSAEAAKVPPPPPPKELQIDLLDAKKIKMDSINIVLGKVVSDQTGTTTSTSDFKKLQAKAWQDSVMAAHNEGPMIIVRD